MESSLRRLDDLRQKLSDDGVSDVHFLGVNSKKWHAQVLVSSLRRAVRYPVHQATHRSDLFRLLGGRRDDVFVYDRSEQNH